MGKPIGLMRKDEDRSMWMVEQLARTHREELHQDARAWRLAHEASAMGGEGRASSLRVLIGTGFVRAGLRLGGTLPREGQVCE